MKKFAKILTIVAALVLFLLTPASAVTTSGLLKFSPMEDDDTAYQFTAPEQSSEIFTEANITVSEMSTWQAPDNTKSLISKQVFTGFYDTCENKSIALTDTELENRSPYIIATSKKNISSRGYYTTDAITLEANAYYRVSVTYNLKADENSDISKTIFGTFYLNDESISLTQFGWHTVSFYIHTDLLETAQITPKLYLGSENADAIGAIYFDEFTVTVINASTYNARPNNQRVIDFAQVNLNEHVYHIDQTFSNSQFTTSSGDTGSSLNNAASNTILSRLNFGDNRNYFHMKDHATDSVMLMQAADSNATLTLNRNTYKFKPNPYEVYMFQFYSIASPTSDFKFYLNLTDTETDENVAPQPITNFTSYNSYHNGWQLNTVFFIAGLKNNQSYEISFSLASDSTTTGWVCLDDFNIYRTTSTYAENNATNPLVHGVIDVNSTTTTNGIANGYFDLGSATGNSNESPYPLTAKDWTVNTPDNSTNGIVSLNYWQDSFGEFFDYHDIPDCGSQNNNFYMMHNTTNAVDDEHTNTLTSPAFTTTANSTLYLAFDAYCTSDANTTANITTDSLSGLGNTIHVKANTWKHYLIKINENEFAASRSYYLQFKMPGTGYTYVDNVRIVTNLDDETTANATFDLANPTSMPVLWKADDENVSPVINDNALTFSNINGLKTEITNQFAYGLEKGLYYEFVINAHGSNANFTLNGYEGNLLVNTDDDVDYKMYIKIGDNTTPNFKIILGSTDASENIDGTVTLNSIKVSKIDETVYTNAKENTADHQIILTQKDATEEETTKEPEESDSGNGKGIFDENWWYLIPTFITAVAILLAIITFLLRKIKFEKHITKKHTSYARDMRLKNQQKKIVAQKAVKVDNVTDESQSN